MSEFRDMVIAIQDDIEQGELSFQQIAIKHEVTLREVEQLARDMADDFSYEDRYYDELERDHDEPYEPDEYVPDPDAWYEDQYDLGDF